MRISTEWIIFIHEQSCCIAVFIHDMAYMKLRNLSSRNTIHDQDEDPMVIIEKRLQEVRQMTNKKRSKENVLDGFKPEVRELIMKYKDIPCEQIKKSNRKKAPKLLDRFKRAVSLVQLLLRRFRGSKRYFLDRSDVSQLRMKMETMVKQTGGVVTGRASIGFDLQTALCTQPHLRDKKSIKQILWVLRATKAFKHLFPAEMEERVAMSVAYERYEDGRILASQGRVPDRFYYVMSGRVSQLRQYQLSTGQVTKSMGVLTKGNTTDPQEIDMQWMREESLVANGQVEVLLLDKKSFSLLQHTTDGPPVEFLQSLHLFNEFPMDRFGKCHDSVESKYYGHEKIIVKDANRTPWLHVVKSGLVKVVRRQSVIDARLCNESKFSALTVEHLGCGKAFSHADAMLGNSVRQKKMKSLREAVELPQITTTSNPLGNTLGFTSPVIYRQPVSRQESVGSDIGTSMGQADETDSHDVVSQYSDDKQDDVAMKQVLLPVKTSSPVRSNRGLSTSIGNISEYEPHDLWLTREKTGFDVLNRKTRKKEVQHRSAYLQLDVLKPGDVFGLDHMQPAVASEPKGVCLLSEGAEVVKISKRFFLQNADNNTMLKVETMYKEYLSEEDAESALYNKETWDQYKAALWSRMTAPTLIPPASSR